MKERLHEVPEVPAVHRCLHGTQDRAEPTQEACREPREEARRCKCPFLACHDAPLLPEFPCLPACYLRRRFAPPIDLTAERPSTACSCVASTAGVRGSETPRRLRARR